MSQWLLGLGIQFVVTLSNPPVGVPIAHSRLRTVGLADRMKKSRSGAMVSCRAYGLAPLGLPASGVGTGCEVGWQRSVLPDPTSA